MENLDSVKYFLPSISEVRLACALMNQLIKDKYLAGDLLDDDISMTVIDFSPFVDEKEKQKVESWLAPIPFILKPLEEPATKTVRRAFTTSNGKQYWSYIDVPADYVLKPGEKFIEHSQPCHPIKREDMLLMGAVSSDKFPTKF